MEKQRLLYLLDKYKDNTSNEKENKELEQWYDSLNTGAAAFTEHTEFDQELADEMLTEFRQTRLRPATQVRSLGFFKMFTRVAVVVTGISIMGAGAYFLFFNKGDKPTEIVKTVWPDDLKAPETNRATITLANGQKIYLDSAVNGTLAMQGNVKLIKLANGLIAYQTASGETINEIKYNTLENPRGSMVIDMTLADGSKVWLNAGSSVTYPVAFVGKERKVSITGEAYFEVAPLSPKGGQGKLHFIVKFNTPSGDGGEVTVLGTHFNVNAYYDEENIKVTLLEGSVKVSKDAASKLIRPGEQASISQKSQQSTQIPVQTTDLEQVMAWKNGMFRFNGTNIKEIMRQAGRWYDVAVVYEGNVDDLDFSGVVSRKENISELLKIFETTGLVNFSVKGKKVIVKK